VKRFFTNELVISFVLTFISSVGFYFVFQNLQLGLVAGLILGLYAYIYNLYVFFGKEIKESHMSSVKLSQQCIDVLGLNDIYSSRWIQDTLNKMVAIEKTAERHEQFLIFARTEINRGIREAEGIIKGKKIVRIQVRG
jgi:hypothetical protein